MDNETLSPKIMGLRGMQKSAYSPISTMHRSTFFIIQMKKLKHRQIFKKAVN